MAEGKAVLFRATNQNTLSKEQDLRSNYDYYCKFSGENKFAEIEKEKGGSDPLKTVIYKSTLYIMLTNKENVTDIINLCIAANYSSVAFDAVNKCFGYYRDLGPDSRIAMLQSISNIYTTQFPYIGRITVMTLSLAQCCSISQSNMWLSQQILDCLLSNIGSLISFSMTHKETFVMPTVLLWCLRKCYDHIFINRDFVGKEVEIIKKIHTLDHESFLRCGVDCISFDCDYLVIFIHFIYLFILRNYVPQINAIYLSILQEPSHVQLLLQTVPPVEFFAFSQDCEMQNNVMTFYSNVQDKKTGLDGPTLQGYLHDLLSFHNANTIWNSALLTELRLCLLGHPNDGFTDMVVDYCFQYVRLIGPPVTNSNQKVPKKDVIDCIQYLLLLLVQTAAKDCVLRYISQTSNLKSEHGGNVLELIRTGMRFAISGQFPPVSAPIFNFFHNAISHPPSQSWWEANIPLFPNDIRELIDHLKAMVPPSPSPALNGPDSKRIHLGKSEERSMRLSTESQSALDLLQSFKQSEMILYLQSFQGKEEMMRTVLSPAIAAYFDSSDKVLDSNILWISIQSILQKQDEFGILLLSACRESCNVVDYLMLIDTIRNAFIQAFKDTDYTLPVMRHNQTYFELYRRMYDFLSKKEDEANEVATKLRHYFSVKKDDFGDVIENCLSTSLLYDILSKEREESPLMVIEIIIIPFLLKYCRKWIHIVPTIKFLCSHLESSLLPLYVPLLENSVLSLMEFDEIKSFSLLTEMSIQELKWFWELYSHGQFIYNKIDKSVKTIFELCNELPDVRKSIIYKAVCDLCKECQPDLQLVETLLSQGLEFATFNVTIFKAWEYAHEEDMFRFFNQSIRSIRLSPQEKRVSIVDNIIFYITLVMKRSDIDDSMEDNCKKTAKLIQDTIKNNVVQPTLLLSESLNVKSNPSNSGKKRKSRLAM